MKKILFVDIDGVLNSQDWYDRRPKTGWEDNPDGRWFDPAAVAHLKRVTDETGAEVVVSSSWKMRGLQGCIELWKEQQLPGKVLDITPYLMHKDFNVPRGCEILKWLKDYGLDRNFFSAERQKEDCDKAGIFNYAIIDDDPDMLYTQKDHFVQTTFKEGMLDHHSDALIEILNTPLWEMGAFSGDQVSES